MYNVSIEIEVQLKYQDVVDVLIKLHRVIRDVYFHIYLYVINEDGTFAFIRNYMC